MFGLTPKAAVPLALAALLAVPALPTRAEHHGTPAASGTYTVMGVRNDVTNQFEQRKVYLPRGFRARPNTCYMWYPGLEPAISWCNVTIPVGAILLRG